MSVTRILQATCAGALCAVLLGCTEHIQEPWVNNQAEWKMEKFETHSPDETLRMRLRQGQSDR